MEPLQQIGNLQLVAEIERSGRLVEKQVAACFFRLKAEATRSRCFFRLKAEAT